MPSTHLRRHALLLATLALSAVTLTPGAPAASLPTVDAPVPAVGSSGQEPDVAAMDEADPLTDAECADAAAAAGAATQGGGDPSFPTLTWAALKTGFRAAVAWDSERPEVGSIQYRVGSSPAVSLAEGTPHFQHAFVLDQLPTGGTVCFQASNGTATSEAHSFTLRNAWTSDPGSEGVYTLNLLVNANQAVDHQHAVQTADGFAQLMWDATDGHVAAGRIILLAGDANTAGSDVVYTFAVEPGAAAQTQRDGVNKPSAVIEMGATEDVRMLDSADHVLLHEVGHYAFGMSDRYNAASGYDCYVPAHRISIMGSNRLSTEFDDDVARCPDSQQWTSWALLRQRYTAIPDRPTGPVAGPAGDGGRYELSAFFKPDLRLPPLPALPVPQDDAGRGRDAPNAPEDTFTVHPGWQYAGFVDLLTSDLFPVVPDPADWYAFQADAGDVIVVDTAYGCSMQVADGDMQELPSTCVFLLGGVGYRRTATIPETGTWFLKGASPRGAYWFTFALDGTPALDPAGLACAPRRVDAEAAGPHSIRLEWDGVAGASAYAVYRSSGTDPPAKVAEVEGLEFVETALAPGTTYTYAVSASQGGAEVPACGPVKVATPPAP